MVFEPSVLFPPAAVWGQYRRYGPKSIIILRNVLTNGHTSIFTKLRTLHSTFQKFGPLATKFKLSHLQKSSVLDKYKKSKTVLDESVKIELVLNIKYRVVLESKKDHHQKNALIPSTNASLVSTRIYVGDRFDQNADAFDNICKHIKFYSFNTEAKPCFANTCEFLKRKRNKRYHTENKG